MAVFRVEHNSNYTILSNYHFKDRSLSLRAKGLLSLMLSLPEDWDYSVDGLIKITGESKATIQSALKELEKAKYLIRIKFHDEKGRIDYIYNIYESPQNNSPQSNSPRLEKPSTVEPQTVKPQTVEPCTVNQPQLNTNILITNKLNTNKQNSNTNNKSNKAAKQKPIKHRHGTYAHVLLTDEEYQKLLKDYANAEECIKYLDEYIEMKGYKANSHYLAIKKWVVNAVEEHKQRKNGYNNYQRRNQRVIPVDDFMKKTTDEDYEKKRKELFDDFKKDS